MSLALQVIAKANIDMHNLKRATQTIGPELSGYLTGLGYDGLIAWEGGEGDIGPHESWVVFDPHKVSALAEQVLPQKME